MNLENVIELRIKHFYLRQSAIKGMLNHSERHSCTEQDLSEKINGANNKTDSNGKDVLRGTSRDIKVS